jgi:hypothetical protein
MGVVSAGARQRPRLKPIEVAGDGPGGDPDAAATEPERATLGRGRGPAAAAGTKRGARRPLAGRLARVLRGSRAGCMIPRGNRRGAAAPSPSYRDGDDRDLPENLGYPLCPIPGNISRVCLVPAQVHVREPAL